MTKDQVQQFLDPNSQWWWWWHDRRRAGWFNEPWALKSEKQKLRELSAFRFELARRADRKMASVPYPKADDVLRDILMPGPIPLLIGMPAELIKNRMYMKFPALAFCLQAPRKQILERIGELIDRACKYRGAQLPERAFNIPNHPREWRLLELLDRRDVCDEKMLSGERSQLSALRREAKDLARTFRWFQMGRSATKVPRLHGEIPVVVTGRRDEKTVK